MRMTPLHDPRHWRDRALEVRALQQRVPDPKAQRILTRIAEEYEEIAGLAKDWIVPKKRKER